MVTISQEDVSELVVNQHSIPKDLRGLSTLVNYSFIHCTSLDHKHNLLECLNPT